MRFEAGNADARLCDYGVSVWVLIGHLHAVNNDPDQVAHDNILPREAVDAALAYHRKYKALIDVRLLLNSA